MAWVALLGGATLMPASAPLQAQQSTATRPASAHALYGDQGAGGKPVSVVNDIAADLPHLTNQSLRLSGQDIIDLYNDPLFSDEAKAQVARLLDEFRKSGVGEVLVCVIPDTHQSTLNTLSGDLYKQAGLGDIYKKNGVVILVNAAVARTNEPRSVVSVQPGRGIKEVLTTAKATDLSRQHFRAHLADTTDPTRFDRALKDLSTQLIETLNAADAAGKKGEVLHRETSERGMEALVLLLLLMGGGMATLGGLHLYQRKKSFEEAAAVITEPLQAMGSNHRVTRKNIYTPSTASALLAESVQKPEPKALLRAIKEIEKNISDENRPTLLTTYRERGLANALPEVRAFAVQALHQAKLGRDEIFTPLFAQMLVEKDDSVLKALEAPLVQLSQPEDIETDEAAGPFLNAMAHEHPKVREIAISVQNHHANEKTVPRFFDRIEVEPNPSVVELLQLYLTRLATPQNRPLYLENLTTLNDHIRKPAVQGLGTLANPEDFPSLYAQFLQDDSPLLASSYEEALKKTASETHVEVLTQGLQEDERVQKTTLSVMDSLQSSQGVAPLFSYLEALTPEPNSYRVEKAQRVLERSVTDSNRPFLLSQLSAPGQPGNGRSDLRATAIDLLNKVATDADVPRLFEALEAESGSANTKALASLIPQKTKASNREALLEILQQGKRAVSRFTAAEAVEANGKPQDVPVLFNALEQESDADCVAALTHLARKWADASNRPLLLEKAQASSVVAVRSAAALALKNVASPEDLSALFSILEAETDSTVIASLLPIFQKASTPEVHPLLMGKFESPQVKVRQAAVRGLQNAATPSQVNAFFKALKAETHTELAKDIAQLIGTVSEKENRPQLLAEMSHDKPSVRMASAMGLRKCLAASDCEPLLNALEVESDPELLKEWKGLAQETLTGANKPVYLKKITSPHPQVRKLSITGLEGCAKPSDLPTLIRIWADLSQGDVKPALQSLIQKQSQSKEALIPLAALIADGQAPQSARQQGIQLLKKHQLEALSPLLQAHSNLPSGTAGNLTQELEAAVSQIGNKAKDNALPILLAYTQAPASTQTQTVATQEAVKIVSQWSAKSYDDAAILQQLTQLDKHSQTPLKQVAGQVRQKLIAKKVQDVRQLDRESNIHRRSIFRDLKALSDKAPDSDVQQAAIDTLRRLNRRLSDYESRQRANSSSSFDTGFGIGGMTGGGWSSGSGGSSSSGGSFGGSGDTGYSGGEV